MSTKPRIDLAHLAGAPIAAMIRVEERIALDPTIRALVKIRASQINGCAHCLDMHWAHAREQGESEVRLAQLATWHESTFFDDRERAALALTEAMTHIAETHAPDDVWGEAEAHFEPGELANLMFAIGAINLWNRLAVTARTPPGSAAAATPARAA